MTQTRYKLRLLFLAMAILAGIAMTHGHKDKLAEADKPVKTSLVLDG